MKISEIHLYQHDLPVKGSAYKASIGAMTFFDSTIVEIITDTGIKAYGETCPHGPIYQAEHALGARAAIAQMANALIGEDPLEISVIHQNMNANLLGHNYAKAAIDIALWDIHGKYFKRRVCDLLGGAVTENVASYYAVGLEQPDEAVRIAKEKVKQGFERLQIKVGGRDVHTDIETITKVWEQVRGEVRLVADANRGWTSRDAVIFSQACRHIPIVLEQPCNSVNEIAAIRSQLNHPVYLDECTENISIIVDVIGRGLCDGFGLKITRLGGLTNMRTVREICQARSLPHTCDDSWGGDIIAAACVHMGATVTQNLSEGVWIADPYIDQNYDQINGIKIKNGSITLPTGWGLGIEPDVGLFGNPVMSWG